MPTDDSVFRQLVAGVIRFQRDVFPGKRDLFARLAEKQGPKTLFLTCSDSRINPNLITSADPGELFICRNIGNVVPPHGTSDGGVATVMEYAVDVLKIEHIVVCGHSNCGAMKSLLDPHDDQAVPRVTKWLRFAETARRMGRLSHGDGTPGSAADRISGAVDPSTVDDPKNLLEAVTKHNVVAQLANLRTYPEVAAHLAADALKLHGWYYDIGAGEVEEADDAGTFAPLSQRYEI